MWENLSPVDIDRARQQLARRRIEIEQELRSLDDKWREIGVLEQLIEAFTRTYMNVASRSIQAIAPQKTPTPLAGTTENETRVLEPHRAPAVDFATRGREVAKPQPTAGD